MIRYPSPPGRVPPPTPTDRQAILAHLREEIERRFPGVLVLPGGASLRPSPSMSCPPGAPRSASLSTYPQGTPRNPATTSEECPSAMPPVRGGAPTGMPQVDSLIGGGFPRGALSLLSGPLSSGKLSLALGVATQVTRQGDLVAMVDGRGEIFFPSVEAAGAHLGRILRVRPLPHQLLPTTLILLESRAFALVLLDLPSGRRPLLGPRQAMRLAAFCRRTSVILLILGLPSAIRPLVPAASLWLEIAPSRRGARIVLKKGPTTVPESTELWIERHAPCDLPPPA